MNASVQAPVTKKVWTILCPEFGSGASEIEVIVRAMYELKLAEAAFRVAFQIKWNLWGICLAGPTQIYE